MINKKNIIYNFQINKKDCGSSNIQIALLSEKINNLQEHFKIHKQDNHSKKGLLNIVSKRRKLLNYIKNKNIKEYNKIITKLKLRK